MREFVVAANWKMHKTPEEAVQFLRDFVPALSAKEPEWKKTVLLFPSPILCPIVAEHLRPAASPEAWVQWGAQNCYAENQGAFTGETSPKVLKRMGAQSVLIGHSERRTLFFENDELLSRKMRAAQLVGLTPMLCIGEQLNAREAGKTFDVLSAQLKFALAQTDFAKRFYIAYEPVWAIGTGKVATPEQAEEAHAFIRQKLEELGGREVASRTPILYGGSVKPDNSRELAVKSNIDGFLVGGASLDPRSFLEIVQTPLRK